MTFPRIELGSKWPLVGQRAVGFHFFDTAGRCNQTRRYLLAVPVAGHKGGSYPHRKRRSVIGESRRLAGREIHPHLVPRIDFTNAYELH